MMGRSFFVGSLAMFALTSCGPRPHLSVEMTQSYRQTFDMQADLKRNGYAGTAYPLNGVEGLALRQAVEAQVSDEESGEPVYTGD